MRTHEWLWEAPLGLLSFAFFRAVRAGMRRALATRQAALASVWNTVDAPSLARPGVLLYFMVTGPRWNVHAALAGAGPLRVGARVEVDLGPLLARGGRATVVLNRTPDFALLGWRTLAGGAGRVAFEVGPQTCMLNLRLYGVPGPVVLPEVWVDGALVVPPCPLEAGPEALLAALGGARRPLFRALHQYVYPMLCARWLPRRWVERELLPIGNPDTRFRFGPVEPGERVWVQADPALQQQARVYVTLFDRQSLPCARWALGEEAPAAPARGFYLLRIVGLQGAVDPGPEALRVAVLPPGRAAPVG